MTTTTTTRRRTPQPQKPATTLEEMAEYREIQSFDKELNHFGKLGTEPGHGRGQDLDLSPALTPPRPTGSRVDRASRSRIPQIEMASRAVELRKEGYSYKQIAELVGYKSATAASQAVIGLLREMVGEPTEELRNLEASRIDELWFECRDMALTVDSPLLKLYAVDRCIKLLERRSKLLGLDAPAKVNIELKVRQIAEALGIDADEAVTELRSVVSWGGKAAAPSLLDPAASASPFPSNHTDKSKLGGLKLLSSNGDRVV